MVPDDVPRGLSDVERAIFRRRCGSDDGRPLTLEEVAYEFGVTHERIREIEGKVLNNFRHPNRARLFFRAATGPWFADE